MQIRYIDPDGNEIIRVDKDSYSILPKIISKEMLQNKADRYYFSETAKMNNNSIWYSKIDLNIERGKIERPYKPVIRIATPVYYSKVFKGIIIINIHATDFLKQITTSPIFEVDIIDHNGNYITSHDPRKSWSAYLNKPFSFSKDNPDLVDKVLESDYYKCEKVFSATLEHLIPNSDKAKLIFYPKQSMVLSLKREHYKAAGFIISIILLVSIPFAFFISNVPAKLNNTITRQNIKMNEYISIINNNVHLCSLDEDMKIKDTTCVLLSKLKYTENELVGKLFNDLIYEDNDLENKKNFFATLARGNDFCSELELSRKNGKTFWSQINVAISKPEGKARTYNLFIHDISDKKTIENLSRTDALTGLYNRRFFNTTTPAELNRAKRNGHLLCFSIIDIDFFKQYNDTYGHDMGDKTLASVASAIKEALHRAGDYAFRLGGEEFGALFTAKEAAEAERTMDKIFEKIAELNIEHKESKASSMVTVSAGLIIISPDNKEELQHLYHKADLALYTSKQNGRNRNTTVQV
jgi:diguanylate cyclase (GGDEF)-like protein/PAS domain S-box-containing protein